MKLSDMIKYDLMYWLKNPGDLTVPNYFYGMYEADLLRIMSGSDFCIEYEIKISRGDFFADFKKGRPGHTKLLNDVWVTSGTKKHDLISGGKRCNRFFFVVPENLVSKAECPKYAGLMYYAGNRGLTTVKPAPLLHKEPFKHWKELAKKTAAREMALRIEERIKYNKIVK